MYINVVTSGERRYNNQETTNFIQQGNKHADFELRHSLSSQLFRFCPLCESAPWWGKKFTEEPHRCISRMVPSAVVAPYSPENTEVDEHKRIS